VDDGGAKVHKIAQKVVIFNAKAGIGNKKPTPKGGLKSVMV